MLKLLLLKIEQAQRIPFSILKQLEDWIQLRCISYAPFGQPLIVYFPVNLHSNLASKLDSSSLLKEHDY